MKAWNLLDVNNLKFSDVIDPIPGKDEVLIKVRACGICGSDIPRIFTKGTYSFPTIPGHEFSGEIVALGDGADTALMGKGAAVFPLIPCKSCPACLTGQYAQCENYNYLGSRTNGAFAEYVAVPVWNLLMLPKGLSYEEAAMVEPAAVALHALRQAGIDVGDSVLIYGAGPIGMMLASWAKIWGAGQILLVDIDSEKLDFARSLGFDDVYNAREGGVRDWVREKTKRGADVTIEGAGSTISFEDCMHTTRTFGKVVLMGNPSGEMKLSQKGYWEILRKQLTVVGTWNSYYAEFPKNEWRLALDAMASGKLDVKPLITHLLPLDRLMEGLELMRDNSNFYCKVMYSNKKRSEQ